jgi:hypothetical protein
MSNVKMKKKKLSQSYGVLVCTAIVFVILFFNQFQLIEGSGLAEEKASRSGTTVCFAVSHPHGSRGLTFFSQARYGP